MAKAMPKRVRVIDSCQEEWVVNATHWATDDYGHAVTLYVNADMIVTFVSPVMVGWDDPRLAGPLVFDEEEGEEV